MSSIQGIDPTTAPADPEGLMLLAGGDIFTAERDQKAAKEKKEDAEADLKLADNPFEYAEALIRRDDATAGVEAAGRALTQARNRYAEARRKART